MQFTPDRLNSILSYCRILRWIREEEEWIEANNESTLKCIILDMTGTLFRKFRKPITNLVKLFHLKVQLANICTLLISAVTAIDTSGIDMVCELRKILEKQSLQVRIANHIASITRTFSMIFFSRTVFN